MNTEEKKEVWPFETVNEHGSSDPIADRIVSRMNRKQRRAYYSELKRPGVTPLKAIEKIRRFR